MLPETDKAPPTSLLLETGKCSDRQAVLQAILERLEFHLDALSDSSQRSALRFAIEEKMRAWLPESKQITFRLPPFDVPNPNEQVGTFAGLDTFGRLRIRSVHDHIETAYADAEIVAVQP